jgi:hypothetical protein
MRALGGAAAVAAAIAVAAAAAGRVQTEPAALRAATAAVDLRMARVVALDARTVNGGPLRVRFVVANAGSHTARKSRTQYLLSRDTLKSRGDVRLRGSSAIGRLRAHRRSRGTADLTLSPKTRAGRWFVIACADGPGALSESSELNNCRASSKRVLVQADKAAPKVTLTRPASGAALADSTPTFAGAGGTALGDSSRIALSLYRGRSASGAATRTLSAIVRNGRWSADATPAVAEGAYTARAEQRDGAGHLGRSAPVVLRVDTTAPRPQFTAPAAGARTTAPKPDLRGRAGTAEGDASNVTVKVYAGTSVQGAAVGGATAAGADWSATTPALPEGAYTARVEQSDSAGNTGSDSRAFTVAPVNAIAVGDIACRPDHPDFNNGDGTATGCQQKATSNVALAAAADTVLALGDLQYERGELPNFASVYDPTWGRLKTITHPASGNHEYDDPCTPACGYYDYFDGAGAQDGRAGPRPKGWYSFDEGAWHIVVLNSECTRFGISCAAGSEQEQWLRADLAAHPSACTAALWHRPRFSSAGSTQASDPNLTPLWQALYDANAELVLSGHAHDYERFAPKTAAGDLDAARGVRQFVAGTGGRSLIAFPSATRVLGSEVSRDDTYGVLQLTLHANSYDWSFLRAVGGSFSDSGSAACH